MQKQTIRFLTLFLVFSLFNFSNIIATNLLPIGSRSAGMGRSSVAITDFWSAVNNQAGIALFTTPRIGIYYESQFLISELSSKSIAGIIPTKYGVFAATYNHFGYKLYNNQKIGMAYARKLGTKFRIGVQLDYLQTTLGNNYGSTGNLTFEIGVQTDVSTKLTIGAWAFNPLLVKLADYDDEKIPAIYRFGLLWHISGTLLATLEAEKNTAISPVIIRGGIEYELNSKFFFRTGFSTNKEIFSFGMGINIKHLVFNISAIMHESLGFSPQTSLIYNF